MSYNASPKFILVNMINLHQPWWKGILAAG